MIDLSTPLSLASSFRFPLQSAESRREIAWGALLLVLLPGIGWFLNMGHRIVVVHRMQHGDTEQPVARDAQEPVQRRDARHRRRLHLAGKDPREDHDRAADEREPPASALQRHVLRLEPVDAEHEPQGDGERRRVRHQRQALLE